MDIVPCKTKGYNSRFEEFVDVGAGDMPPHRVGGIEVFTQHRGWVSGEASDVGDAPDESLDWAHEVPSGVMVDNSIAFSIFLVVESERC